MYKIDLSKKWFDDHALPQAEEDALIADLARESAYIKNTFGADVLRNASDQELLTKIPSRGQDYTLYHEMTFKDRCKCLPGIGRYPVDGLKVFYKGGAWYKDSQNGATPITEQQAIQQVRKIRDSLVSMVDYIETNRSNSNTLKFYDDLYSLFIQAKSNIGIKGTSVLIEKYLSYLYPNLFPPFYSGDWKEMLLDDKYDKENMFRNYYNIKQILDSTGLDPLVFGKRIWSNYPCITRKGYKHIKDYINNEKPSGNYTLSDLNSVLEKVKKEKHLRIRNDHDKKAILKNVAEEYPGSFSYDEGTGELTVTSSAASTAAPQPAVVPPSPQVATQTMLKSEFEIYYGIPGCGKSYRLNEKIKSDGYDNDLVIRTVFYPEYTNADFIGQYMPRKHGTNMDFIIKEGPFARALASAFKNPDKKVALVIEEINRGNASAIFGEIFQLLDVDTVNNRSQYPISNPILTEHIKNECGIQLDKIYIPGNMSIYGTMNTSDQNVFKFDTAFKRRWKMKRITNNPSDFDSTYDFVVPNIGTNLLWSEFVKRVNEEILANGLEEDRQLGYWFYKKDSDGLAPESFGEKVLEYLWNDVTKYNHEILFNDDINTFDKLLSDYLSGKTVFRFTF